jgi:inner membrane protein
MDAQSFLASLGPWTWWIIAGLCLIVELAVPGMLFIWLAIAAAVVGGLNFFADLPWQLDVALFAVLSVVFVLVLRPWYAKRNALPSDQPNLNQRLYNYVGQRHPLSEAIVNGSGKVSIEDTLWSVTGPDLPKGAMVAVKGVEGMRLKVERAQS